MLPENRDQIKLHNLIKCSQCPFESICEYEHGDRKHICPLYKVFKNNGSVATSGLFLKKRCALHHGAW